MIRSYSTLLLLPALLAGCNKPEAPQPEKLTTPASASAQAVSSAVASASAHPEPRAIPAATSSPDAPLAVSASSKHPAPSGPLAVPKTQNGVLAPQVADRILKGGAKPIVRLVDAGSEPRAPLAYTFAVGKTRPLAMGLDMVMGMKAPGQALPPTSVPRLVMTLDLNPAEKNPKGEVRIDGVLRGLGFEPKGDQEKQIADRLHGQLDGVKGMTMKYWVSPRGNVHDVKIDMPSTTPAQAQQVLQGMSQSFESMVSPLPEEPVGVGGKWQVISRIASSGADLLQFATFTLKSREGTRLGLDVALEQLAASDKIAPPGLPPGISAKMTSFKSGGGGNSVLDTTDVAPDAGTLSVKSAMEIAVEQGAYGKAEAMGIESTMTVHFTRPDT